MRYCIAIICLLQLTGCGDAEPDYETRIEAANGMVDASERNTALANIAVDAADSGEGDVVKDAIRGITDKDEQMRIARESALSLAKAGEGDAAVDVAKLISEPEMRDNTLKQIAQDE